jgi:hypothetical protein
MRVVVSALTIYSARSLAPLQSVRGHSQLSSQRFPTVRRQRKTHRLAAMSTVTPAAAPAVEEELENLDDIRNDVRRVVAVVVGSGGGGGIRVSRDCGGGDGPVCCP